MQTFFTHIGYNKSLQSLDDLRLGKQRVEAKQILMVLGGQSEGYQHHPAVKMWKGWEQALCLYGAAACYQWHIVRKHKCDLYPWFYEESKRLKMDKEAAMDEPFPPWTQDAWFMRSHRSNLIRKNPVLYEPKWPNTPVDMPYFWPVNDADLPRGYFLKVSEADAARLLTGERRIPDVEDLVYDAVLRRVIQ
jgi:hypothetical protein